MQNRGRPAPMSGLGQSRRFGGRPTTSGALPSVDIRKNGRHVSKLPFTDSCAAAKLFDNFVGAGQKRRGQLKAKCICSFKIDDQLELGWLLHRQIARFRSAKNLVDVVSGAPKQVEVTWSVR